MEEYKIYYVLVLESVNIGQEWILTFDFEKSLGKRRLKMNTAAVQRIFGSIATMNDLIASGTPKAIAFDLDGQIMMANVTTARKPEFAKAPPPIPPAPTAEMTKLPSLMRVKRNTKSDAPGAPAEQPSAPDEVPMPKIEEEKKV